MRLAIMLIILAAAVLACQPSWAQGVDWSGYFSIEPRYFPDDPLFRGQPAAGISPSVVLAPEYRFEWNEGGDRITVIPFYRYDADDGNRSHFDLREANWQHSSGRYLLLAGIGKAFWGVTESRHLVDIVNQTDLVEDIDEEDKLGQPMLLLERWTAAGTISAYLLPGFRQRTFPARGARLSGPVPVDTTRPQYESSAGDRRTDLALRWAQSSGAWDVGVSGFHGTSREPRFLPATDNQGLPVLLPLYEVITQVGVDLQYTRGSWLWKLESIGRRGPEYSFAAAVGGFEYTIFGIRSGRIDLGLLAEYLYDGREADAPPVIYDNGIFVGVRASLNDAQDSTMLAGVIVDQGTRIGVAEVQRRIGESWKLELEARWFAGVDADDPLLAGLRNDSFITLRMARFL